MNSNDKTVCKVYNHLSELLAVSLGQAADLILHEVVNFMLRVIEVRLSLRMAGIKKARLLPRVLPLKASVCRRGVQPP